MVAGTQTLRRFAFGALLAVVPFVASCDSEPLNLTGLPAGQAGTSAGVDAGSTANGSGDAGSGAVSTGVGGNASGGQSGTNAGATGSAGSGGVTGQGGATQQNGGAGGSGGDVSAPQQVPYTALAVSLAEGHFCVLLDDHNVKCWGSGIYGELGDGSPAGVYPSEPQIIVNLGGGRTVKSLSTAFHASCALLDDDSVKCWGYSEQLGIGATEPVGDQPEELGAQLPAVDLGAGRSAAQMSLGHAYGCALLDDGNARCWDNLPHETFVREGPAVTQLAGGHVPMALFEDGSFGSLESNERELFAGSPALSIEGDSHNVCALLETGTLSCGDPFALSDTTLDLDTTVSFAIHGPYGSAALCVLDTLGVVRCQGPLDHPELWMMPGDDMTDPGLHEVNLGAPAVQIASGGDRYACAVLEDGRVKCWGDWNRAGNYGAVDGEIQALDLGTH
jgi:hypothetical protein